MTTNLEAFLNLNKTIHKTVKMGDGVVCEIHGKGDVHISPGKKKLH